MRINRRKVNIIHSLYVILLIMVTILIFTSCKKSTITIDNSVYVMENKFVSGQDSSYMFQGHNNDQYIVKAENGYFFRLNGILYFGDETLDTFIPLCTQANCLHGQATTEELRYECGAYIGAPISVSSLQYYNNNIYVRSYFDLVSKEERNAGVIQNEKIYSISSDGAKKRLLDIDIASWVSPIFHRGYIYYSFTDVEEEDSGGMLRPVSYGGIARRSLATGKEDVLLDRSRIIMGNDGVQEIYAYQNYIYFRVTDKQNKDHLYVLSLLDNKLNKIETEAEAFPTFYFMGDKLIYTYYSEDMEVKKKVYRADLDGSNEEYIFDIVDSSPRDRIGADDNYIYVDNGLKSEVLRGTEERTLRYYDIETYEYLGEVNLGNKTSWLSLGYGDENYYFYFEIDMDKERLMYFDKADLATGNVELKMLLEWEIQ